ncbi:MAG: DNA polymerase/3'-5' exonuclease PolX, partial [Halanaerobiales bacterium]
KGIAATIREIFDQGYSPLLEEIKGELPVGVVELINIPGLGPKRAHQLFYELDIQGIEQLRRALEKGEVRKLKGFGEKSEKKILTSLKQYEEFREVSILYKALLRAEDIIGYLNDEPDVLQVETAGSIRRRRELIGDIDLLLAGREPSSISDRITGMPFVKEITAKGEKKLSIITEDNYRVDFRIVSPEAFPAALQYFTGSKEHNVRMRQRAKKSGYKLNEYGLFTIKEKKHKISVEDESDIYRVLDMDYIIPELREDRGEIEAAAEGNLPDSITYGDIKGDLHLHSSYSDGAYRIKDMVEAAREKGYQYLAITDHSQSLRVAHGMTPDMLLEQIEEIERIQENYNDIKILKGIEVDINTGGKLDYEDEILEKLDLVIASIHTGFNQSEEQITKRILSAIRHPLVNIIGHPRGRILKKRTSYQVDIDRIIEQAAEYGTCLEINASPYRLDLDDINVKKAKKKGAKIAINTDSHHLSELDDMLLGVTVARRGWLECEDVLNTMPCKELLNFLRRK